MHNKSMVLYGNLTPGFEPLEVNNQSNNHGYFCCHYTETESNCSRIKNQEEDLVGGNR